MQQQEEREGEKKKRSSVKSMLKNTLRFTGCVGIGILGATIDGPAILSIAFAKSPIYFYKGFRVTLEAEPDLGPALTTALALIWPVRVIGELGGTVLYSLGKGFKGGVVAYEQKSFASGIKHIIAAVAEFDEYTNDVVLLREGSCLPRPAYKNDPGRPDDDPRLLPMVSRMREIRIERVIELIRRDPAMAARVRSEARVSMRAVVPVILHCVTAGDDEEEEEDCDAIEVLRRQIRDAGVVEDDLMELVMLPKGGSDSDIDDRVRRKMEALGPIRRAMLEAFARRIRGISAFLCGDDEFRKCLSRLL